MNETWRPVMGFEGTYEVSDQGRVRSPGRVLRDARAGTGYRKVNLYENGRQQQTYVHRLVAAAFLGPCLDGQNVNHKDGDKTNNHLSNLEYVSSGDNTRHAARTGLLRTGERHQNTRLTIEQVAEIRRLYQPWTYSTHRLAREFGVSAQTIHNIIKGRTWST